ncbi:hypothetical protein BX616_005509 [Lobosporangium transversale]|nr:hypothetical protein BX616_005509 [Lobosporangium transversale]
MGRLDPRNPSELARFDPEDVYNCDETGLFLKAIANKTLVTGPVQDDRDTMGQDRDYDARKDDNSFNCFQETLENFLGAAKYPDSITYNPELITHFNNAVAGMEMFVEYKRLISVQFKRLECISELDRTPCFLIFDKISN